MPSVELSKLQAATAARALNTGERAGPSAAPAKAPALSGSEPARGVSIEVGAASNATLETATPPVDRERVAEIRKALEEGRYPLVPTRIADAMIAARVSLGMER